MPDTRLPFELLVADWRRRVAALYETVRTAADPEESWQLWVETRRLLYERHPASPLPAEERSSTTLSFFPYDPALRTVASLEPAPDEPARASAGEHAFARVGRLRFSLFGDEHTLDLLWLATYGNGLFLPFGDATNGATTYGGGRYLLDTVKGADLGLDRDRVIIDFNFAYAPSCAWDAGWSCPLPPAANRLAIAVRAGESFSSTPPPRGALSGAPAA
ncbi:MAG: DUF1684 domain-containing protein [Actinobacteria bacterium]|nr:DUF1684 domain-containing protein [Actinomycetota bacterium]